MTPRLLEVLGRQPERPRRVLRPGLVLPQNRCAALGRDHRIDGVFEHQDAIPHPETERSAGSAFPGHHDDDRHR